MISLTQIPQPRKTKRPGLTIREVADRYDRSVSCMHNWIKRRWFPPANLRLGTRTVLWSLPYLEAWERHVTSAGSKLNAAEFAAHKRGLWQGDTDKIARQVKGLIG